MDFNSDDTTPSSAYHYLVATAFVVLSLAFTGLTWEVVQYYPYLLAFGAVALSAWHGGSRTGLYAAMLGGLGTNVIYIEPKLQFSFTSVQLFGFIGFLVVAALISVLEGRRRTSEQKLREARDELRIILDGVADGITVQDEEGLTVYANQAAATLTGFDSASELLKTTSADRARRYELLSEDGQPIDMQERPRARAFSTGQSVATTMKLVFRDRTDVRWIHLKSTPVFDERRRAKIVVNILQDVTERTRDEQAIKSLHELAESQRRRLDSVISNLPGMVYESVVDPTTGVQRYTYISPYAEQMYGYSAERIQSDPQFWQVLIHPDDIPGMMQDVGRQMAAGESGRVAYRAIRADGEIRWCEAIFTMRKDSTGALIGTSGVVLDITDRKLAEQASALYAHELRRSNEELEQFAYVASHDLQEPLRMITSYLQLIEQRFATSLDEEAKEFINFAVDGASRMKTLITDLLTYSRVQRAKLEFSSVSLGAVVSSVTRGLELMIRETGAEIICEPLPEVIANEGQITQLLQNLIANAIKFRRDEPPKIHLGASREKAEWIISVRDNGIGFDDEYADRIFVIFQRLHGREKYPGTGIGLAVCKKIVERHNGRIWVDSKSGEGSTFYFSLPIQNGTRKVSDGER